MACPICLGNDVYAYHRRSVMERGPLTWIGLLPFRCGQCQSRFYRIALKDPRRWRKTGDAAASPELRRSPRWPADEKATVTVEAPGQAGVVVDGVAVNVSMDGVRLRLAQAIPEGSQVRVALEGTGWRLGEVRWVEPIGEAGVLHGVRFQSRLDRQGRHARPLRWIRFRRLARRGILSAIGLLLIATAAYGLVWWLENQRKYRPRYYEPKDVERQIHDLQQDLREVKPPRQP